MRWLKGLAGPMPLGRLFWLPWLLVGLVWLGTCGGLYQVSLGSSLAAETASVQYIAEAASKSVVRMIESSAAALDQWVQEPELADALASGDAMRVLALEERLTRLVPGAALVRLVSDTTEALDEGRAPKMGYADLDLVRQTKTGKPAPTMHAANSPDAHIAIVRHLPKGDGVLLASLMPKLLQSAVPSGLPKGAIELKQKDLTLAFSGDAELKTATPAGSVSVPGTSWSVHYWGPPTAESGDMWFLGLASLALLLTVLAGFLSYLTIRRGLFSDQDAVARYVEDLVSVVARLQGVGSTAIKGASTGGTQNDYDFRIKEMQRLTGLLKPLVRPAKLDAKTDTAAAKGPQESAAEAVPEIRQDSLVIPSPVSPSRVPGAVPAMSFGAGIFSAEGIKGIAGETLTPEAVNSIGWAFGTLARERGHTTVSIGRDVRQSSTWVSEALCRGVLASGCSVIELGTVPTPVFKFAAIEWTNGFGVVVSGDDDSPEINGLKLLIEGVPASADDLQKVRHRIEQGELLSGQGGRSFREAVQAYVQRVVDDVQVERSLKVVVDCGNGAASLVMPALLQELGCEVVPLYCEPDGQFPNRPCDLGAAGSLDALMRAVVAQQADLGVALNCGGDGLAVVDSSGKRVATDSQLMLLAPDVLSREPGSDIVFDVKSSRHLAGYIVRHGGRPLMWKADPDLIGAKALETGAQLAGEAGGHIFFKERWYGFDDGMYAGARLLELLAMDDRPSSDVFGDFPASVAFPELTLKMSEEEAVAAVKKLKESADLPNARQTDIDGFRLDFARGWGLVRIASALPGLVVHIEGDDAVELHRTAGEFESLLKIVKPDFKLPMYLE